MNGTSENFDILLETVKSVHGSKRGFFFSKPVQVVTASDFDRPEHLWQFIDQQQALGRYVAGYFSYEFAYWNDPNLRLNVPCLPGELFRLGVYSGVEEWSGSRSSSDATASMEFWLGQVQLDIDYVHYAQKLSQVRDWLCEGQTYQLNFTDQMSFSLEGSVESLYGQLKRRQDVAYAAHLSWPGNHILSLSPELFFRIDKRRKIVVCPMKGTLPRVFSEDCDRAQQQELQTNLKLMSENVMIVDLLRNDLGRVCQPGSVQVRTLFDTEAYATLWQMTSRIVGRLKSESTWGDVFEALFPCGSVTGAPKRKTMELIAQLERLPRSVYTGAIGYFAPDGCAQFNVPIRTLELKQNLDVHPPCYAGRMGVGSGLVYDSRSEEEYEECLLKARFLTQAQQPFELIETLLWHNGFYLEQRHLERMRLSAQHFGIVFDVRLWEAALNSACLEMLKDERYRVRLLLRMDGCFRVQVKRLGFFSKRGLRVALASSRVCSDNVFLYHKTTHRSLYRTAWRAARAAGFYDVLFLNEREELCEGAISNVLLKLEGRWVTPPVRSGLLNGVQRQHLLHTTRLEEQRLFLSDLQSAEKIFLINSVAGICPVRFCQNVSF